MTSLVWPQPISFVAKAKSSKLSFSTKLHMNVHMNKSHIQEKLPHSVNGNLELTHGHEPPADLSALESGSRGDDNRTSTQLPRNSDKSGVTWFSDEQRSHSDDLAQDQPTNQESSGPLHIGNHGESERQTPRSPSEDRIVIDVDGRLRLDERLRDERLRDERLRDERLRAERF
ncbi:hypothetical protein K402DRAFT_397983 [Aulographum hederae CBS 113979]|uniref:Uncharacterized protein n=1 Tax=Aulographum hederae CBS 113979 TaxID=1176131 RepID=A0A6G1GMN7_9PEZI|nr:hypothetical protein K402DRAFT_397983 [Aulographum hederae CBS 113979]